eukprot:22542-Amphidinium_carterae.2
MAGSNVPSQYGHVSSQFRITFDLTKYVEVMCEFASLITRSALLAAIEWIESSRLKPPQRGKQRQSLRDTALLTCEAERLSSTMRSIALRTQKKGLY